jgi:hypothetical protein
MFDENSSLLGYDAMNTGIQVPMLQRNLLPPSSGQSKTQTGSSSEMVSHPTWYLHQHHCDNLKSRMKMATGKDSLKDTR